MLAGEPKDFWISPPLGLLYIASYLEKQGHTVLVKDTVIEDWDYNRLTEYLKAEEPDLVGITSMINTMNRVKQTAEVIKNAAGSLVVLGGPHVTTFPEETMEENPNADFLVVGEGEKTLHELIAAWNADSADSPDFAGIEGLLYRKNEEIVRNGNRPWIEDLDAMPFPARHLIDLLLYDRKGLSAGVRVQRRPATSMIISRGCPFHCTFCYKISGKTYRIRSPKSVIRELEILIHRYGVKEVLFIDDNFTLKNKWVMDLCSRIIKGKLDITWSCLGRVAPLSDDMLQMMRQAGCLRMDIGIETGTERLLKLIRKGVTRKDIQDGVTQIGKSGIKTTCFFIVGLPTETLEEARETIRFARNLDLTYAAFSAYSPFPGTELSTLATRTGVITADLPMFDKKREVYRPDGWNKGDVDRMLKRAYREFYLHPRKVLNQLKEVRSPAILLQKVKGVYYLFDKRLSKREV